MRQPSGSCAVRALAIAAAFGTAAGPACAQLPTGAEVVQGTADISSTYGQMTIRNSPNAVLNWQSFSIGGQNSVRFEQQSASSKVLNRVVGNDPSRIMGGLSSNGEVWLVNPHGVLFGRGARVDVGGLVASTLAVSNEDFRAGRYRFGGGDSAGGQAGGQVLNEAAFDTSFGGRIWLLGDSVSNSGAIGSPGGHIVLAAGRSIELVDSSMPHLAVRVTAPANGTLNLGSLLAPDGGSIDLHGAMVNQEGMVRADSVGSDAAGRIVIRASGDVQLAAGSLTGADSAASAGSATAGQVLVESTAGTASVLGTVSAASAHGAGGRIDLLGQAVDLSGEAFVDASGAAGGGQVRVDARGAGTSMAMAATLGASASVLASATRSGDGGTVIVRSGGGLRLEGGIEAAGGPDGGKGGEVETSAQRLYAQPRSIDVGASDPADAGSWLLASNDLSVVPRDGTHADDAVSDALVSGGGPFVAAGAIDAALARGAQLRLRAAGPAGRLVVAGSIGARGDGVPGGSLSLEASGDLVVNAGVRIAAGGNVDMRAGAVRLTNADIGAGRNLRIAGAGAITLDNSRLGAAAGGDAITLSSAHLANTGSRLSAPNGRWLVYLDRGLAAFPAIELGDLDYTFVQVGAAAGSASALSGAGQNGVLMADPLDIRVRVDATRSYDGTDRATFSTALADDALPGFRLLPGDGAMAGRFADRNAGAGKSIVYLGEGAAFGVVTSTGRPVYGARQSYTADILPKALTYAGLAAADKVYDGTRSAPLAGSLAGVVAGDRVDLLGATGLFDTKDVGAGKLVTITGGVLAGADAANYVLDNVSAAASTTRAAVTHRPVEIVITGEVRKEYDGTSSASLAPGQFALLGAIANDALVVRGPAQGSYDTPEVGRDKVVSVAGSFEIGGADAANYRIGNVNLGGALNQVMASAGGKVGTITPAPPVQPAPPPVQPPVQPQGRAPAQDIRTAALDAAVRAALPALALPTGARGLLDWPASSSGDFGAVRIGSMDQDALAQMLAGRRDFKRKLFADAVYQLEIDPNLADVRPCATVAEASAGACRLTAAQLEGMRAARPAAPATMATGAGQARARTANLPQIARKIAVLVGIDDYADKDIPRLENSLRDAHAIGKLFADRLGYEVRVLRNPDKAGIIAALNALAAETDDADSVVVYYAGHGHSLEKGGAGYWMPVDAAPADPRGWISNSDIARLLANIRARQLTLVSDSCYSGNFAREGLGAVGRNVTADEVLARRSVVVLSSGGDEPVADEGKDGHSIFAWHLMRVVGAVSSWKPGSAIFTDVQKRVSREFLQTPKYGSVTAAGHQAGGDYLFEMRSR